jgi:hypothetical protein
MLYKQFSFISYKDGVLSDEIVLGVTVRSGSKIIKQLTLKEIKEQMSRRWKLQDQSVFDGMLIVDFAERGYGTEFIDTRATAGGFKQLSVELDVVNAGTVNLVEMYSDYYEEIALNG